MTGPRTRRPPRRKPLDPARRAAFDVLRAVSERDAYANLALPALLRERGITGRDAAFATELTYGTCRTRGLLDAIIGRAAGRPPERIDPVLLDLLRLGTYQLLRTRVDAHAAVSTTVEQAGIEFDSARAGFVNGVLRTISGRDEQSWVEELAPPAHTDPVGHTAFVHAHPRWIAQAFADALGADAGQLDALLASDDERPLVHLAARPGVLTADALAESVRRHRGPLFALCGVPVRRRSGPARAHPRRRGAGAGRGQPAGGPGADAGAGRRPTAGGGWICAPGPVARPRCWPRWATTRTSPRSSPTRGAPSSSRRTPAACEVDVRRVDGREPGLDPGFDRVLVDAPCTGLGALRRRPEARWRRQPADVPALAKLQRELLASAIRLTRPGGVVLYATCSPHLAETVGVVADALRRHPVTALDARPLFDPVDGLGDGPYVQLWPHRHGTDAMFAAALKVG